MSRRLRAVLQEPPLSKNLHWMLGDLYFAIRQVTSADALIASRPPSSCSKAAMYVLAILTICCQCQRRHGLQLSREKAARLYCEAKNSARSSRQPHKWHALPPTTRCSPRRIMPQNVRLCLQMKPYHVLSATPRLSLRHRNYTPSVSDSESLEEEDL